LRAPLISSPSIRIIGTVRDDDEGPASLTRRLAMGAQFVVQVRNRPGELAHLVRGLAERGVNIVHCAGGGAGSLGYAILETEDDVVTRQVLRSTGASFVEGESITVELEDHPGALAGLTERLGAAGIDIRGLLMVGCRDGMVLVTLTVDDPDAARRALDLELEAAAAT
jgi:hypothetical protein